ncbi:MAG: glycoside hydrolase family 2 protein [Acholeplasmatales bacterium]|nr:MAG: glycoside hydrolase family 2 protein [Acholeplasmatales bacterium]
MIKKPLNFDWTFKTPAASEDVHGFSGQSVDIPHNAVEIPQDYFDETAYQGIHSYQKTFSLEPFSKKQRVFIAFEGVMSCADVYVNGVKIGGHVGGYTAFMVEATQHVKPGENRLYVQVDSHERPDHPPFGGVVDYLTYAGIYREVALLVSEQDFVERLLIDGDASNLHIAVHGNAVTDAVHALELTIENEQGVVMHHRFETSLSAPHQLTLPHQLAMWSPENPVLYSAKLSVDGIMQQPVRFGIRTLRVDADHFYVNDTPIFLRGLNRHQSFPYVGYAMPWRAQAEDAELLKHTLGCVMVRSSHYPPSRHFLDRCDELGLLVFTELPGWQHLGDETWKAHAMEDLRTLILDGYNHPSVVIIGTRINESQDDDAFYEKTRDLAKSLDSTRPTGGVRYIDKSTLLEDIYTYNDFSHNGLTPGLKKKRLVTRKDHPYLITEYNGHMFPTKATDDEPKRIDHARRHFTVLDAAYGQKGVMGALGWCMFDYHTHQDFGSNNHICHHGVLDMNRNDKYAAAVYASQGTQDTLNVLSMMHLGDKPGGALKEAIVATNLEEVVVYKNDTLIGTYRRHPSDWPNLPHPPIVIRDFIGQQIEAQEPFSKKDARKIKAALIETLQRDLNMTLRTKLLIARMMLKYKLKYADIVRLYTRYIGGWGEKSTVYRFEGRRDNETVLTVYKGRDETLNLTMDLSTDQLIIGDTYDVARVRVTLSNGLGERAVYSSAVADIICEGPLHLIGPSTIAMQGGIQSFWVRTLAAGTATITVRSRGLEAAKTLHIRERD